MHLELTISTVHIRRIHYYLCKKMCLMDKAKQILYRKVFEKTEDHPYLLLRKFYHEDTTFSLDIFLMPYQILGNTQYEETLYGLVFDTRYCSFNVEIILSVNEKILAREEEA